MTLAQIIKVDQIESRGEIWYKLQKKLKNYNHCLKIIVAMFHFLQDPF